MGEDPYTTPLYWDTLGRTDTCISIHTHTHKLEHTHTLTWSLSPRLVCLFLKRGADYNARDHTQKDPITIAVETANADIVTL